MSQLLRSFDDLVAFIKPLGIPMRVDADNHSLMLSQKPPALLTPLFVRWDQAIPFLQLMQQITDKVGDDRVREIETALAHVNDVAMIPGYGFSYENKIVYYRLAVPRFGGGITGEDLDRAMTVVLNNALNLSAAFVKVVEGEPGAKVLSFVAKPAS